MLRVTKQALIASAAQRWLETYAYGGRWPDTTSTFDPQKIYTALQALPADVSEAQITAITGRADWTQNICDECGQDRAVTVGLGQEIHHAIDTKYICLPCLEQAVTLAKQPTR